jgi:hypothetical protein
LFLSHGCTGTQRPFLHFGDSGIGHELDHDQEYEYEYDHVFFTGDDHDVCHLPTFFSALATSTQTTGRCGERRRGAKRAMWEDERVW